MLLANLHEIGNRLLLVRKRLGLTQAEAAEAAGLADRTYADIERGSANMRIASLLRICDAFHITPDELLTDEETPLISRQEELFHRLESCTPAQRETALNLLQVYLHSINQK